MGCDIHGWVEKNVNKKWITIREFNDKADMRNYKRFALLAGVRGDGPDARGLPKDISDTARYHADVDGPDGHSHSWLPLKEALPIFLDTTWNANDYEKQYPASAFFDIESENDFDEYRIVFWFDN